MNTREIAGEYRLSHWARIMKERAESGLNIRAYCNREGFHENVYYYWQRKLREAACEQMVKKHNEEETTSLAISGFTEVKVANEASALLNNPPDTALHIEIGGVKITADSSYPAENLAALLKALLRS